MLNINEIKKEMSQLALDENMKKVKLQTKVHNVVRAFNHLIYFPKDSTQYDDHVIELKHSKSISYSPYKGGFQLNILTFTNVSQKVNVLPLSCMTFFLLEC